EPLPLLGGQPRLPPAIRQFQPGVDCPPVVLAVSLPQDARPFGQRLFGPAPVFLLLQDQGQVTQPYRPAHANLPLHFSLDGQAARDGRNRLGGVALPEQRGRLAERVCGQRRRREAGGHRRPPQQENPPPPLVRQQRRGAGNLPHPTRPVAGPGV